MVRFGLDFVYERENFTKFEEMYFDGLELCGLPTFPDDFNSP